MEWGHRVLGRVIGLGFIIPLAFFAARKRLTATLPKQLFGMALLLGAQGALGWYMVKSGLEDSLLDTPGAVPRVSQYRLAAHLGTAFVLYAGMFGAGIATLMDWRYAKTGGWAGLKGSDQQWRSVVKSPLVKRFLQNSRALTALVFLTALSGELHAFQTALVIDIAPFLQVPSSPVWMLDCFTMSSHSWADGWLRRQTSYSRLHTPKTLMGLIYGGVTSLKILLRFSSTTDVL